MVSCTAELPTYCTVGAPGCTARRTVGGGHRGAHACSAAHSSRWPSLLQVRTFKVLFLRTYHVTQLITIISPHSSSRSLRGSATPTALRSPMQSKCGEQSLGCSTLHIAMGWQACSSVQRHTSLGAGRRCWHSAPSGTASTYAHGSKAHNSQTVLTTGRELLSVFLFSLASLSCL